MPKRFLKPCMCGGQEYCPRCGAEPGQPVIRLETVCFTLISNAEHDVTFNGEDAVDVFEETGWGHLIDEVKAFYKLEREKERSDFRPDYPPRLLVDVLLAKLAAEAKRA